MVCGHGRGRQVEPRSLKNLVEDLAPAIVVGELNHPPENPLIRPETENRVAENLVEECVGFRVIVFHDQVPGLRQVLLTDVDVHSVLPVRMAKRLGRARRQELTWDKEVVSHSIGRQVREVSVPDRLESRAVRSRQDFFPHMPVMAVSPSGYVLLCKGYVCRDRAIEEVKWVGLDDGTHGWRKQVECGKHPLTKSNVGSRAPRPKRLRQ